jgi:hypothetical protein
MASAVKQNVLLILLLLLEPKLQARVLKQPALPLRPGMLGVLPEVLLLLLLGPCAGQEKTRDGVNVAVLVSA